MPIQLSEEEGGKLLEIHVSGKLAAADYEHFVPEFDRLVQQHGRLRVLFDMTDFHGWDAGALWEDTKFAVRHFSDIERLAGVGENKWQHGMTTFCKPFTRATIRYFDIMPTWLRRESGWAKHSVFGFKGHEFTAAMARP